MPRATLSRALLKHAVVASFCASSCGGSLPLPPTVRHPPSAYQEIPYPPPAALAETVPERPDRDVVWVDGEWFFSGSAFTWHRGGWVVAPPSARFAPWHAKYRPDGRLMLAQGAWYDSRMRRLPAPEPIAQAYTPPNEFISELEVGR